MRAHHLIRDLTHTYTPTPNFPSLMIQPHHPTNVQTRKDRTTYVERNIRGQSLTLEGTEALKGMSVRRTKGKSVARPEDRFDEEWAVSGSLAL
jgi:hypothetical protein